MNSPLMRYWSGSKLARVSSRVVSPAKVAAMPGMLKSVSRNSVSGSRLSFMKW